MCRPPPVVSLKSPAVTIFERRKMRRFSNVFVSFGAGTDRVQRLSANANRHGARAMTTCKEKKNGHTRRIFVVVFYFSASIFFGTPRKPPGNSGARLVFGRP